MIISRDFGHSEKDNPKDRQCQWDSYRSADLKHQDFAPPEVKNLE